MNRGDHKVWLQDGEQAGVLVPPQKARNLGGPVLVLLTDIPSVGQAAVLKDPDGAFSEIFQKRVNQNMRKTKQA